MASAFPTTCDSCHSTSGWRPARFDHTTFALTGAHATASCARCHPNNRYTGTPRDCFSCHQAQYNAVANPNHVTMAFPTNCDSCHTTSAWRPAQFAHTNWPLTGAHTTTSCARCHPNSRYTGTPRDCYSCHQARYNATTTPNHQQVSYPTTCESCHTTTAWQPANFNHTFPIRTGNHAVACTVCHNQPTNFPLYTCLVCHEHSQSSMNSHHSQVSGYSYVSTECVRCHPNGRH